MNQRRKQHLFTSLKWFVAVIVTTLLKMRDYTGSDTALPLLNLAQLGCWIGVVWFVVAAIRSKDPKPSTIIVVDR